MKNTKRSADFINIKQKIYSSFKLRHLCSMLDLVLKYGECYEDGDTLKMIWKDKRSEILKRQRQ